jgi:hemolysin-activating ACP:hemolysin acyltransferase
MSEFESAPQAGAGPSPSLQAVRDANAYAALGRAVSYLMTKPNFAALKFGQLSRMLTGQINRKHYFLATDGKKIVGFAGWALVDEAGAKLWLEGGGDMGSAECLGGDCMVINAWAADNNSVNRFVLHELRKYAVGCKAAYAKRFYKDGTIRPLRVSITEALENHVRETAPGAS